MMKRDYKKNILKYVVRISVTLLLAGILAISIPASILADAWESEDDQQYSAYAEEPAPEVDEIGDPGVLPEEFSTSADEVADPLEACIRDTDRQKRLQPFYELYAWSGCDVPL